ncbi:hypothetical protein DVK85_01525 [Flavobacterium arcticum]|uniref:Uncharacterized protein n=1 Tax=Flavobacterium arcticum TaxID=1784713 RepID=A0A345H8S2_9FLAO|nr:hypothetical protein DVK85_01525 [Flavobacterium arcticum]
MTLTFKLDQLSRNCFISGDELNDLYEQNIAKTKTIVRPCHGEIEYVNTLRAYWRSIIDYQRHTKLYNEDYEMELNDLNILDQVYINWCESDFQKPSF